MSHLLKLAMQSKIIISDLLKIDSFFFYFFYFHTLCTCSSHCLLSLMPPLVVFVTMDTKIMFGSKSIKERKKMLKKIIFSYLIIL